MPPLFPAPSPITNIVPATPTEEPAGEAVAEEEHRDTLRPNNNAEDVAESSGTTPIADKYRTSAGTAVSHIFNAEPEPGTGDLAVDAVDGFDFSPPESLKLVVTPLSSRTNVEETKVEDEESQIQSPYSDGQSPLPLEKLKVRKSKSVSSHEFSESDDESSNSGLTERKKRILVGAVISLIVVLVPCFVMMVYLFAVRNHLIAQLDELGVKGSVPLGSSALSTLHPAILYDQQDSQLAATLGQPITEKFQGLRYEPSCNSTQLEIARQLAMMSRYSKSVLLETNGCDSTKEQVLSVLEQLNLDISLILVCEVSEKEDATATWVYDTVQLVRAFPKLVQGILLKPLESLSCSEVESYVIYLKRQLAVRRQGIDVSVYPSFDIWSRDLLSLVDVIGINYAPESFGSSPQKASSAIRQDLAHICNDLPLKEFLISGLGWPASGSGTSENLTLEFITSWVCWDAPKLSSRVHWYYESGLDGTPQSLDTGLFDTNYRLRYAIEC